MRDEGDERFRVAKFGQGGCFLTGLDAPDTSEFSRCGNPKLNPRMVMMLVPLVAVGMFELADQHRHTEPQHQGDGELERIVRMELEFGQEITASDAKKSARTEGERATEEDRVGVGKMRCAHVIQGNAQRSRQRKQDIQQLPGKY